ncbi:DUF2130 domain-containing protein [Mycoplasma iguanae]|uniref:DUF2130 domain-containing protein n=1 Tax=Mycoplasma iguanae TaxID=292461 RepID=A0ABY5R9L5_9MOLU|nr:DUF2130 domain-containing protein [Mycoplasma iguanae]UVD81680.1 DUF2130 domain-containing protein [Mycoplasma iguanae]
MSKKITVKLKDKSSLKFELLEDAQKGDFFILNDSENTDTVRELHNFLTLIETKKINEAVKKAESEKELFYLNQIKDKEKNYREQAEVKIKNALLEQENQYSKQIVILEKNLKNEQQKTIDVLKEQINKLKLEKNNISLDLENQIKNKQKEIEINQVAIDNKYKDQITQLKLNLQKIENEYESFKNAKENEFKALVFQEKEKFLVDKIDLTTQITNLTNELNNLKENTNKDQKLLLLEKEKEISNLKTEIEQIKRNKSNNSKVMGEELENWILDQYNIQMGLLSDCSFEKTTKAIEGKKPDFLFKVLDINHQTKSEITLSSVVIEAKTDALDGLGKKNENFYDKLNKDKINHNAEYALLVSELEIDSNFVIKKVNDAKYENMYVVRPFYLFTFLSLIYSLTQKNKHLLKKEIDFKEKQNILKEFEDFKNQILDNSVKNINNNLINIISSSEKIFKNAEDIKNQANVALETHLATIKNKINSFSIERKIIDKIN